MKLSIIVCTYNRAHAIGPCLDSIAMSLAHAAPVDAEIVVVDNASTDNTSALLREWAASCAFPVQVLFEAKKGLSAAQNTGIRAAHGELLAFTDDDCRLSKEYVVDLLRHDTEDGGELIFRGGRIELGNPADLPLTIKTDMTTQRWHKEKHPQKGFGLGCVIIGANMMMRRALIDKLGFFDERFGPGLSLPAGSDVDYIYRAYLAGIIIEYVPNMVVYHHHGRQLSADRYKLMRNYIIAEGGLYFKYLHKGIRLWRPRWEDIKNSLREIVYRKNYYKPDIEIYFKDLIGFWSLGIFRYFVRSMKKSS